MKSLPLLLVVLLAAASLPTLAADVSVSVNVGQPGSYGSIEIGNAPPPRLLYSQPMIIEQAPSAAPPVYLYVPPYQARHWRRYCRRYGACGRPAYFVQQQWYEQEYVPHYHQAYGPPPAAVAVPGPAPGVMYAHDIHSDVVRARVIRAHDVHTEVLRVRTVYHNGWEGDVGSGDIHTPQVEATEIRAHDIHARVLEADVLYVHDLHANQ